MTKVDQLPNSTIFIYLPVVVYHPLYARKTETSPNQLTLYHNSTTTIH